MSRNDNHSGMQKQWRDITKALAAVTRSLEGEPDIEGTVQGIVAAVVDTVPGADHAAVSLLEGGELRTVAATGELVHRVNEIEHQLEEGPCVDAVRDEAIYRIDLMTEERRWPRFAAAAQEMGIGSMLGFRLFTNERTQGSLDLYAFEQHAFDTTAELTGELFAAHAAVALAGSAEKATLRQAMNTRDTIGMAKGILMHRERIGADQAFTMLVTASQHANMKLRDVADWLISENSKTAASSD
ncbi:GAF and ANTAR domain-containing protein [Rhodococcus sp. NPDC058521]|uniref:GAF and ANTAR domain-containing protein n=1 Tax=Rhodococcus sp. NPDC058521 TaxID=3346536 RepID=UPI0036628D73